MQDLNSAFTNALASALQGDALQPLGPEDLAGKSRPEIEEAVRAALYSPAVAAVLSRESLMHTLLLDMARAGKRDQTVGALQRGADIHFRNEDGETALILAAASRSLETVRALLLRGADVHVCAPKRATALHVAATNEDEPIFLELLDFGADVKKVDADGRTAVEVMRADEMETCACAAPLAAPGRHCACARTLSCMPVCAVCIVCDVWTMWTHLPLHLPLHCTGARRFVHYHQMWTRRRQAAARLVAYSEGTLPSISHPACYAERRWSERCHVHFPPCFRHVILLLLLASNRREEGEVCCLPSEMWTQVRPSPEVSRHLPPSMAFHGLPWPSMAFHGLP